ncbi:MAG TPA: cysteine--tRNA ligase [Candidatus Saccharimonadales bacterium]|nr:cysteine--tRNA ligase [Candidatus Saccharimonadales bacterium]
MKFYDSLKRQITDFTPLKPPQVKLYTCGPTVYDYAHIGNLRTFVFYDTLKRALTAASYKVNHVMNITDVGHLTSDADEGEDKLEKGAKKQGKSVWDIANFYIDAFKRNSDQLNLLQPQYARATDFIKPQLAVIKILIDKGFAYQTEQAIYFDVTKLDNYGELTGQRLSDKEIAVRPEVVQDKNKHHPYDFAIWFFTLGHFADHSMHWSSPWGEGFPGWHLECSAIIHKTLGDPIDIHAAGVDLIGTHNTNEAAQTEAAFGHKIANYWLHSEHLLVDGQKMSKSLGNFYTLDDILERGYDPIALRLLFLQAHYRSQMNFTWEALDSAQNWLHNLRAWADLKYQGTTDLVSEELDQKFNETRKRMLAALQNDLNTADALSILSDLVNYMSSIPVPNLEGKYTEDILPFIDSLLGLELNTREDINPEQKQLIAKREEARNKKQWQKADEFRQKLSEQGIEINDSKAGPVWSRVR